MVRGWLWVLCSVLAAGQPAGTDSTDVTRLEAIDISSPGAPVLLWGRIEFSEAAVDRELRTTFHGGEIAGHNRSEKAIVTLVVRTERASERTTDISLPTFDWFFSATAFSPGAQQRLQSFGGRAEVLPYGGDNKPFNSQFTVEVVYAQFDDGSEFGERRHAIELLTARKHVVEHLRKLNEILERDGAEAFVEALRNGAHERRVETVLRSLRERHERSGIAAARAMLRGLLRLADQRRATFDLELRPN